jgi:glycosyltransferase involved in cell wall biosynthesis
MNKQALVTGGHRYEHNLLNIIREIATVDVKTNELWLRGYRKCIALIVNVKYLFKLKKYDAVIFNSSDCVYWIFLLPLIRLFYRNIQVISTHHHYIYLQLTGVKKVFYYVFEHLFLKFSTALIIPSPYILQIVKQEFPKKKIYYLQIPFKKRQNMAVIPTPTIGNLLFMGTIEERKGLKYLIESLIYLTQNHICYSLTIVGKVVDLQYYNHLLLLIKEHNLNVMFKGFVTEEEKEGILTTADVFVFPSLLEGFGIVIVEAMSYGLPVVAFDNSAMPYTIKDGYNGSLCKTGDSKLFADKITHIITNRELRATLSQGAFDTFESAKDTDSFIKDVYKFLEAIENTRQNAY